MMLRRVVLTAALCAAFAPSAYAVEAWVGRWAIDPATCGGFGGTTPATASLVVTDTSLNWYSGYCSIAKMYKIGQSAYIQARCSGGTTTEVPVTLAPRGGDRMRVTWNNAKGEELRRCK